MWEFDEFEFGDGIGTGLGFLEAEDIGVEF